MECLVYFDDLGYMSLIVLIIHMYLPKSSDLFEKEPLPMLYLSIIWYTLFKTVIGKIKLISCSLKKSIHECLFFNYYKWFSSNRTPLSDTQIWFLAPKILFLTYLEDLWPASIPFWWDKKRLKLMIRTCLKAEEDFPWGEEWQAPCSGTSQCGQMQSLLSMNHKKWGKR